ncbi:hypothetical protein [Flavobacteriaceae bacterium 14752]|uniref:hypothetical protein n=1 Tax=Mesohalobacter salilacus TaxID=2491711 RepID=UPI000F6309F6|nr:hypothetical protein EIG84_05390 [Flavobacteriaceae bacterium 14752]
MNKPLIFLILILIIFSCNKKKENRIDKSYFQNKTFSIHSKSEQDTLFIEFQDSTYQRFDDLWQGKTPWRISSYENLDFLVLESNVIGIKKLSEDKLKCTYIGLNNNNFDMTVRNPDWSKDQIYGTWIEEKYIGTDSTDFPPPPIEPENNNWNWPPSYTIDQRKIQIDFYNQNDSEIEINNSNEFIKMELNNIIGLGIRENIWRIKYLTDSIMIVDKKIDDFIKTNGEKNYNNIKLIKKR